MTIEKSVEDVEAETLEGEKKTEIQEMFAK